MIADMFGKGSCDRGLARRRRVRRYVKSAVQGPVNELSELVDLGNGESSPKRSVNG